jgi:hypothetical protein
MKTYTYIPALITQKLLMWPMAARGDRQGAAKSIREGRILLE